MVRGYFSKTILATLAIVAVVAGTGIVSAFTPVQVSAAPAKQQCDDKTFRSGTKDKPCITIIQTIIKTNGITTATNSKGQKNADFVIDGLFGPQTANAVKAFQGSNTLGRVIGVDGVVGPVTWKKLCGVAGGQAHNAGCDVNPVPPKKDCAVQVFRTSRYERQCVYAIQDMINGWRNGQGKSFIASDGKFGPETYKAVRDFQTAQKKTDKNMKVDGIVGKQTWGKLCTVTTDPGLLDDAGCDSLKAKAQGQK